MVIASALGVGDAVGVAVGGGSVGAGDDDGTAVNDGEGGVGVAATAMTLGAVAAGVPRKDEPLPCPAAN